MLEAACSLVAVGHAMDVLDGALAADQEVSRLEVAHFDAQAFAHGISHSVTRLTGFGMAMSPLMTQTK
jgi:hypothetical protein